MLGFEPFCLDLGCLADLDQNRPQRRQSPGDGAGATDVWTDKGFCHSPFQVDLLLVMSIIR